MSSRFIPFLAALGLAGLALLAGGCATASQSSAMIAAPTTAVAKHSGSISIAVTGGAETSALGASNISNADFATAIRDSITQSGLFERIAAGADIADYALTADIVRLDRPTFGASFTVHFEVTWRLTHRGDEKPIWEKSITSTFTAKMGDSLVGVKRLRLANEGAARTNIQDAVAQMSALSLP